MSICHFQVHPKQLADLLANAVDIGKDNPRISVNSLVMLSATGAYLYAYGRGRYTAGRDWRELKTDGPLSGQITLTEAEAEELASVLRGVEGAGRVGTVVDVSLTDRGKLVVFIGSQVLCDLPDADPENLTFGNPDEVSDWEEIESLISECEDSPHMAAPQAFTLDMLTRLNKIRAKTNVADISSHPSGKFVGVALGPSFRGLAAGVDRDVYADGGKWGDGPGHPEDLWGYLTSQEENP